MPIAPLDMPIAPLDRRFFPWKLHDILEGAEAGNYADIISWLPGDEAFRVHDPQGFVDKVMPQHFQQTHYKSFQRQCKWLD